ncbi:GGDEF domain-containing protein [Georgenia wangjunii]|uniref:GGDEF domain-containing protein n=1 Tax=Georgenia wangjunii TaxID=3117730 RepID=UPI002F263970
MTLDVPTLLVFSAVIVMTSSGMFLAEAWARIGQEVDRLWSIAFASAMTTAVAYLATAVEPDLWWINAIGNATSVLTVWAMWCGIRAHERRSSRIALAFLVAGVTAVAVLVEGPDGGSWAGGVVVLVGTALGALGASAAILRGSLRSSRPGALLAMILALAGGYYTLRTFIFITAGPTSEIFVTYLGTAPSTIITSVLVNAAAFVGVMLRTRGIASERALAAANFDPVTGVRSAESFATCATQELRIARAAAQPVAFIVIAPEELDAIAVAYDRGVAVQALVTCGEIVGEHRPAHGLVGKDPADEDVFHVLVRGYSGAEVLEWATSVRKDLINSPVPVPGSHVRLTASFGVAKAADAGYDLPALREAAAGAARAALAAGGNRVVVAGSGPDTRPGRAANDGARSAG